MSDPFDFDGIQFLGEGYFVFPSYAIDPKRSLESYRSPWELWVATLARARLGDFSWVPSLLGLYSRSDDYVLKAQCADLLADAGSRTTVARIREAISTKLIRGDKYDPQFAVDMSQVLFANMRLGDVPLLLSTYQGGAQFEDTQIIISYMEYILGEIELKGGVSNLASDSSLVTRRVEQLKDQFGTDEILLWWGEPFSIAGLAEKWLKIVERPDPITLRRTFEATTGIDCRTFFKDEEFQPLTAAAVVEEFLESTAVAKYKPGVRFFFGHRIPD
jgi:hypothetical protein